MCGIAGFLTKTRSSIEEQQQKLKKITQVLSHRGPDDEGIWLSADGYTGLGHRRLAIIDLSRAGTQPMRSQCGRYIIVFNGEVYNYLELKAELKKEGHEFISSSDTEVVLTSIIQWGMEKAITKFIGMFAFCVWDSDKKRAYLARDRFGEKPLYYTYSNNLFLFASEIKSLKAWPEFIPNISKTALDFYMHYGYVGAPYTIYENTFKLLPGHMLTISDKELVSQKFEPVPYWTLRNDITSEKKFITESDMLTNLEILLLDSVKKQCISNVSVGAFLSGGIDSSLIVALMQTQSTHPVKTFTIGFTDEKYNEAPYAKAVAAHLGADHSELYVSSQQMRDVIPLLPTIYDEPFADSSQIPTYLVSQLARGSVTVCLSGDGGDELFGGYNHYKWCDKLAKKMKYFPLWSRIILSNLITKISPHYWDIFLNFFMSDKKVNGDRLHKLSYLISSKNTVDLYNKMISTFQGKQRILAFRSSPHPFFMTEALKDTVSHHLISQLMYLDGISYLPDDILTKVDRASMAVSLEVRAPFLDHRISEFLGKLPNETKFKANDNKWLLKEILYKYVPSQLVDRPKMGFGIPLLSWLKGDLREWAEEFLSEKRITSKEYFNYKEVHKVWQEHLSGKRNWQNIIWPILMFESWYEHAHINTIPH